MVMEAVGDMGCPRSSYKVGGSDWGVIISYLP